MGILPESVRDFIAGGIGGICRIPPGHPFDTVKVNLQSSNKFRVGGDVANMRAAFSHIWRIDGVRGLYRGAQSPLAGMAFLNAVLYASGGVGARLVGGSEGLASQMTLTQYFYTGLFAGVWTSFAEGPVDFLKCQLQMRPDQYRGFFHCTATIVRNHGFTGIFQGLVATNLRNVPAYGLFFATYEGCRNYYEWKSIFAPDVVIGERRTMSLGETLLAGGIAGWAFWGPTYAIDVVKSAIQADATAVADRKYSGTIDCFRKLHAEHGWAFARKGFAPCMLRAFPANAAAWFGYEYGIKAMDLVGL